MDELLSVDRLRRITDESERLWRRRLANGELPVVRLGANVRVRRTDFEQWLESRIQPARTGRTERVVTKNEKHRVPV